MPADPLPPEPERFYGRRETPQSPSPTPSKRPPWSVSEEAWSSDGWYLLYLRYQICIWCKKEMVCTSWDWFNRNEVKKGDISLGNAWRTSCIAMIPTSSKLGLNRLQAYLFPKNACYTVCAVPNCICQGAAKNLQTTPLHVMFSLVRGADGWSYSWRLKAPPTPFKLGLASHPKTVCVFSHSKSAHVSHAVQRILLANLYSS